MQEELYRFFHSIQSQNTRENPGNLCRAWEVVKFFPIQRNLRTRLIGWFLLIALVPLVWMTVIAYEIGKTILFEQASRNLQAFNMKRQERLVNFYFQERKEEVAGVIDHPLALESLTSVAASLARHGLQSLQYEEQRQKAYAVLAPRLSAVHYDNFFLITKEGTIAFSLEPSGILGTNIMASGENKGMSHLFNQTRTSLDVATLSLIDPAKKSLLDIFIAVPLLNVQQQLEGVAIIELKSSALYRFLSTARQNETLVTPLLVTQVGQRLFAVAPTEGKEAGEEVNPNSSFGQFIQQLLKQSHLVAFDIDYLDHKNLMVGWRFQLALDWAFVTIVNQRELLMPIARFQYLLWMFITLTVVAVVFAASQVARKLASPILALIEKTKQLAAGDLSQRMRVDTDDEMGRLGESFNNMAAQLDDLVRHLDQLVAKRTQEYENQNIELQQTIRELHMTQDRLVTQEKLASLGALTAGIAHEIKNPLNFVNNFSELSQELVEELQGHMTKIVPLLQAPEGKELGVILDTLKLNMGKIYAHGKRADSIVRNMLQHSRGMPGERVLTSIHKLLDEYATLAYHGMRAEDSDFNVTIETQYDADLPPLDVVPQEIGRVFLNLLNNAYYSISQKKKKQSADYHPKVVLSTARDQSVVVIKIWDNGMGIAPHVLPKLFTPFFTTKPPGEGTGLGLSLSYNIIVQGHGGSLSVTSREGDFAEFTITLPCHPSVKPNSS